MMAYERLITTEKRLSAMKKSGLWVMPSGRGLEDCNEKLQKSALMKLGPRPKEVKVELSKGQMNEAIDLLIKRERAKLRWECPNVGCDVVFDPKNRYIKNTWPLESIINFLLM